MKQSAVGMIETIGLTAALEAADAAVKSANVSLIGYENAKGGGLITVKVAGDVGAVKAAVEAARAAALKVGRVHSVLVIPRPAPNIENILYSSDTVGHHTKQPNEPVEAQTKKGEESAESSSGEPNAESDGVAVTAQPTKPAGEKPVEANDANKQKNKRNPSSSAKKKVK